MNPNWPYIPDITDQDRQILALMVKDDGSKNKTRAIANELGLSENYIYHLLRILKMKFCVSDNTQLVIRAIQMGIISSDGELLTGTQQSAPQSRNNAIEADTLPSVNSSVNSSLQRGEFAATNPHYEEGFDYPNSVNSGVNSSLQRDVIEWLGANQHRAGLTALIARAIQEGVIAPPTDKEQMILDWLHDNPDKAHLGCRTIAALIGDVSHTYVDRVRKRAFKSGTASYQQLGV